MFVKESMQAVTDYLEKALSTKTVVGEPMQFGDITLIPVVDVMFGFGAGGGEGTTNANSGTGGGGGGGARVSAKAMVMIKDGEVSVLPLSKGGAIEKIIDAIPGIVEKVPGIVEKVTVVKGPKAQPDGEKQE
jgi:uncharacterized spore protein YtfJ